MNRTFWALGLGAVLMVGCTQTTSTPSTAVTTPTPAAEATTASTAQAAPYDLQFIDTMIVHHQGALDMAKQAEGKLQAPELKKMAGSIQTDQQREIAQMKQWRESWYPGQPSAENMELPGMKESMQGMDHQGMTKMKTGADFDRHFVAMMLPHHEGAVVMAKDALSKAQHPELKQLAQQIVAAQNKEIAEMAEFKE